MFHFSSSLNNNRQAKLLEPYLYWYIHKKTPTVLRNKLLYNYYGSVIEIKHTVHVCTVSHLPSLMILNVCFRSSFAY